MIKAERSPLGTAFGLTIHRITGSKEATTLLNRCGIGIPYTDVRDLNNKWAKYITMEHNKMLPRDFTQGRSVHITFDNSDGKQQTSTCSKPLITLLVRFSRRSMSGEPFSTIHGDLITETTINLEVKVRGGQKQGGYSTNEQTTGTFIKTSDIMANLKATLKDQH